MYVWSYKLIILGKSEDMSIKKIYFFQMIKFYFDFLVRDDKNGKELVFKRNIVECNWYFYDIYVENKYGCKI